MPDSLITLSGVLIILPAGPGGFHHADKVLIRGDRHGKVAVERTELVKSDFGTEIPAEVVKNLLLAESALEVVRVLGNVKPSTERFLSC